MADVKDIGTGIESFVSFHWKNWYSYKQTQELNFEKLGGKFYIMVSHSYYSGHNCHLSFSITFTSKPSLNHTEIKLSAHFSASQNEYVFILNETNGTSFTSKKLLVCEPDIYRGVRGDLIIKIYLPQNHNISHTLATDINQLLSGKAHSDLKIIAADEIFDVHRNIIAVRCDTLGAMIKHSMMEKQTNTIKLVEWEATVVKQLLNYIYADSCDVTVSPLQLFKLSHYLGIKPLQNLCKHYLKSNINIKSIVDILDLVDKEQYELLELKSASENFIASNEEVLAKDLDYIEYLSKSIKPATVVSILKFSHRHKIQVLIDQSIKYIVSNHKEILQQDNCQQLLVSEPSLMFELLKNSLDVNHRLTKKRKR